MTPLFSFKFKAMGSPCELHINSSSTNRAEHIYFLVKQAVEELEARYSRFRKNSLLSKINHNAGKNKKIPIDNETLALLTYAQQCYEESNGLFDITSGILRKVWHSKQQNNLSLEQIQHKIDQYLPLVNWLDVRWDTNFISLQKKGMEIDFGGIVKEYAADCVKKLCLQEGVKTGYINMGGDLCIIGALEHHKGWPIAIQHPQINNAILGTFKLKQGGLASSGDYERFIMIDNKRYSHIINPKTGWPVSGLQSVSITSEHCITAGSIATIAMLKGQQGVMWLKKTNVTYLCYCDDGKVYHNFNR